jgi:hypothetical protein
VSLPEKEVRTEGNEVLTEVSGCKLETYCNQQSGILVHLLSMSYNSVCVIGLRYRLKDSCIFSSCVIGLRYRLKSDIISRYRFAL